METEFVTLTKEQHEELKSSLNETVEVDQIYLAKNAIAQLQEVKDMLFDVKDLNEANLVELKHKVIKATSVLSDFVMLTELDKKYPKKKVDL